MKFTHTLSSFLFATSAFAGLAERQARRDGRSINRQSKPLIPSPTIHDGPETNTSKVEYSSNWSGVVLTAPPSGSTFNSVSAQFVVPTPSGTGSAAAWVGIDGDTYQNAILQTGVDFTVGSGGAKSYDAWYEWYPDYSHDFSGITIHAGDTILATVRSSSATAGVATIENLTTGVTVTKSLTSSSRLGGQNAEWIVEDYEENGSEVQLTNFGTVVFSDAVAGYSSGGTEGPGSGTVIDLEEGSTVYTSVSGSSSSVTVRYV
ncbi:hypothetical protein B7494_g7340 [Chlorociboria aeruginascens]|nr:hypothetical protein B7494_g7340 [Chlorociboria aeruginascens]